MGAGFCKICGDSEQLDSPRSGDSEQFDSPRSGDSSANSNELRDDGREALLESKHKVFLSHSGAQKAFVEHLCVELERCFRFPFFDRRRESLPIGENFPKLIFDAIQQFLVGVVILSEEFFTSKWPMMELVAMVEQVKKNPKFVIIPVYLCTSIMEFKDPRHRDRWRSCWHRLALESPSRVKAENWEATLNYLNSINGLEYGGSSEVEFQRDIVDAICRIVPADIRLEDSYIQGRSRLCQVIQDKIDVLQNSTINGVCVVGLYGMGGMGKTSICKALCNEYFTKFCGRVCLAELEKGSEKELLQGVVQSLSETSLEHLRGLNVYQLENGLRVGSFIKEAVFLALDNLLDSSASIKHVEKYLSAKLPSGSIVMVTTRSKALLLYLRQYINENNCIQMPELNMEEAKSLFVNSCGFMKENEVNERLIERCVVRCCFRKDDRGRSDSHYYDYYDNGMYWSSHNDHDYDKYYRRIWHGYDHHYHPLALDVLGRQLGRIAQNEWSSQLRKIDEDVFNQRREKNHPMFSILRNSFDTLSPEDQLLFIDVALFLPHPVEGGCNVFEWLGMVHSIPSIDDVKSRLESLKTKSLLERLGDGTKTRIGMHDLWRSFCVAETGNGELGCRRWAYVAQTRTRDRLFYTTPSGIWQNVQRIAFLGFTSVLITTLPSAEVLLQGANFAHFPNVSVLKTTDLCMTRSAVLNLSGLIHLRSLEVSGKALGMLELGGLPRGLIFLSLRWDESEELDSDFSQHLLKQIECLEELEYLQMIRYGGDKLPNLSSMISMRKAVFHYCGNVVTLSGLGPHLQVLDLRGCWELQSCLSVGDLVVLEELNCRECSKLENLPDLQKLRKLHKLDISECGNINEVPGLGDLEALVELYAGVYRKQLIAFKVPDLRKLKNLQVLHFGNRHLEAVPGFDNLISLRKVVADFQNVDDKPRLLRLTKLEELKMDGWSLAGLSALQTLTMLRSLEIDTCSAVDDLPDLENLVNLQILKIVDCKFKDVSGLSNLSTLERLQIERCTQLEIIPALQRLTRLKWAEVRACPLLRGWEDTLGQDEGRDDTTFVLERRDSMRLLGLQTLTLSQCASLTSIAAFSMLETLDCWEIGMRELPDLSNFPHLRSLTLWSCESLEILTCHEPMHALSVLFLHGCSRLATLPDLCNFPGLLQLRLEDRKMTTLSCSVPLTRLQQLVIRGRVTGLPDMGVYFPAITKVELAVLELETLISTVPLPALRVLELRKCWDLKALPDLQMFPALESLDVFDCRKLSRLSSSEPLPALQKLDARKCISLNPDDIVRLRALCPNCFIKDIDDTE